MSLRHDDSREIQYALGIVAIGVVLMNILYLLLKLVMCE